jgi:peptidoglycan/xylan/chitin deacetylase (PgdA/CDA1 family)
MIKSDVYLTFDDGPVVATGEVLDALRGQGVKATFFLCATALEGHEDLQYRILKRMLGEGHSFGNHGYDHDPTTKAEYRNSSVEAVKKDFTINERKLKNLFVRHGDGFPSFSVARLPGDGRTFPSYVDAIVRDLHLPHAVWDYEFAPNGIFSHVSHLDWQGVKGVAADHSGLPHAGDIVLLHDRHWKGRASLLAQLIGKVKQTHNILPLVPIPRGRRSIRYP